MKIRKTALSDVPAILDIYEGARKFMAENGNPNQWTDGYPDESTLLHDIERGDSYVITDGSDTVGTFSLINRIITEFQGDFSLVICNKSQRFLYSPRTLC